MSVAIRTLFLTVLLFGLVLESTAASLSDSITTHEPEEINIFALNSSRGEGFMQLLGSALTGIAENRLSVELPSPQYIE